MIGEILEYWKWHIIFAVIVIICGIFVLFKVTASESPDLRIAFVSSKYINLQYFKDNSNIIELLLKDVNGDAKQKVGIDNFTSDDKKELTDKFTEFAGDGKHDLFIADKQIFEAVADKSIFIDAREYMPDNANMLDKLEVEEDGPVYAVSLKGNKEISKFGLSNTDNLYISVVNDKEEREVLSDYKKNAENIAMYIIENKDR